jgi:hypothetical protein
MMVKGEMMVGLEAAFSGVRDSCIRDWININPKMEHASDRHRRKRTNVLR